MKTRYAISLSLLLHMLPLLILLFLSNGKSGESDEENQKNKSGAKVTNVGEILPPPGQPTEVDIVEAPGKPKEEPVVGDNDKDCKDFIGGIGINTNVWTKVVYAPAGYPAANAGIKPGVYMITPIEKIRGKVGTKVTVRYTSSDGSDTTEIELTRAKICVSGEKG